MDIKEWTATVTKELKDAGFEVSEFQGLPLVKVPEAHPEIVRLLKFRTSLAADRTTYAEGMVYAPPILRAMARQHEGGA